LLKLAVYAGFDRLGKLDCFSLVCATPEKTAPGRLATTGRAF